MNSGCMLLKPGDFSGLSFPMATLECSCYYREKTQADKVVVFLHLGSFHSSAAGCDDICCHQAPGGCCISNCQLEIVCHTLWVKSTESNILIVHLVPQVTCTF